MLCDARFHRNVGKRAVSVVAIQRVVKRGIILGIAVTVHPLLQKAVGVLVDLPAAVVHHEQVQQAVVVVIEPAGADRPHLLALKHSAADTRLVGGIGEGTVAVIVKELIARDAGDEDVGPAVVIVVAHGHAGGVA